MEIRLRGQASRLGSALLGQASKLYAVTRFAWILTDYTLMSNHYLCAAAHE